MGNSDEIEYELSECSNVLSVRIVGDLLEEMGGCENALDRERLLHENAYEPYYTFTTANQFGSNLSAAPCFLEELTIKDDGTTYATGEWYFYNEYMIHDFTVKLAQGETVTFTRVK